MSPAEIGLRISATDTSQGVLEQIKESGRSLKDVILELGKAMEAGGKDGADARRTLNELSREMNGTEKAAKLAAASWEDHNRALVNGVGMMNQVSNVFNKGLNMMNQYNVAQIRVTQAEEAQKKAAENLAAAKENLAKVMETEPDNAKAVAKAQDELTKAEENLQDTTKRTADAHGSLSMMMIGFVGQAPAFMQQFLNIRTGVDRFLMSLSAAPAAGVAYEGATGGMTAAQHGFNLSVLACPVVWVIAAIVAAVAALYILWETDFAGMRKPIQELWDLFSNTVGPGIKFVVDNVIGPALRGVVELLKGFIGSMAAAIQVIKDFLNWVSQANAAHVTEIGQGEAISQITGQNPLFTGQGGGFLPYTGLFYGHKGELLLNQGQQRAMSGPQIHIEVNFKGFIRDRKDIRELANLIGGELNARMHDDLQARGWGWY